MLEHGASLLAFDRWARRFGLRQGDRYLIVNPFFHCFGYKAGWMACLQQGATALPMAALDIDRLLTLVTTERVSALPGPPTLFSSLLDRVRATPTCRRSGSASSARRRYHRSCSAASAPSSPSSRSPPAMD